MESNTSKTSKKMCDEKKSIKRRKFFKLISLSTVFSTILITLLQIYIIVYRFKQLAELSSTLTSHTSSVFPILISSPTSSSSPHPHSHLYASIIVNIFVIVISALFTIAYAFINPFKIGVNAHDNFKLGKNLDSPSCLITHQSNISFDSDQSLSSSSSIVKQKRFDCFWFKRTKFWSQLPPLGATCHLLSALLILISDLLFVTKRIELGQVPSGDIFLTRLDFLFGQPIERQPSLGNMFSSKDDFSGSARIGVVNLDYFNYALAVFVYTIKLAEQFWSTSKRFSLFIFMQALVVSLLMVVSVCGLEIIIKAVLLKRIARDLLVVNTDWHAYQVSGVFLVSLLVLHINLWVLVRWGYSKYEVQKSKFQSIVQAYLINCNKNGSIVLQHPVRLDLIVPEASSSSMGGRSSTQTNSSEESNESEKTSQKIRKKFSIGNWKCCDGLKLFKNYSNNLISSVLFLLYCMSRSVFVYDTFICLKSTHDVVLIMSLLTEMLTFIAWLLGLLFITRKTKWAFDLDVTYRLVYWNQIYEKWRSRSKPSGLFVTEQASNSMPFVHNNNEDLTETSELKDGPISTITISESDNTNSFNNKHPILLVRDDSIMSKSGKMSSSSITEVSSLLPSMLTGVNKQQQLQMISNKYQLKVNEYSEHQQSLTNEHNPNNNNKQQQMATKKLNERSNQTTSSSTMDKVSPSGFSSSSSSSSNSTAVDSGRDSFIDSSPINSALSSKYLFGLPLQQQFKVQQHQQHQLKQKQQTVILGLRNSKCLDTHC